MVTGGYAGVGAQLTSILYSKNATVWIAGRSESKAQKTIDSIKAEHPDSKGTLNFLKVDLSDLTTIKPAAEEFLRKETKLHWLNQNAGIMVPPKGSKGAQGMDLQYQTNILGPFLLAKLLQPLLQKTAESEPKGSVRVSWAGSLAVVLQSPAGGVQFTQDGKDLAEFGPPTAYGVTKASNYLLASEFGKRSGTSDGVLHNVCAVALTLFRS
jgi:retinol dehydrogenase 12